MSSVSEGDVMQVLAALLQEARDPRVVADWLDQLDLAVAGAQQDSAHALLLDHPFLDNGHPQDVAPERERFVDVGP